MLALGSSKIGTALGFIFYTQKREILIFLWKFLRLFTDLGKTRENLKLDGEVCNRNKDKFRR